MKNAYRFCFTQLQSPTYSNLQKLLQEQGWHQTDAQHQADFSEKNFEFNIEAAECLEFKNLLAQLVSSSKQKLMPTTFCINDENWPMILNQVDERVWILKPATLNNGQHIKIIERLSQLEHHYLSPERIGGEYVLQQYLLNPHLLKGPEKGHKYSIRMFVVLTNYAGAFLFPHGYFNIALHPYQSNEFSDLRAHLTNEHLNEPEQNVAQIPTEQYDLFKPFYPQIKSIVSATVQLLKDYKPDAFICQDIPTLAIFGFDFMVDSQEQVWLLEANHGPCFPTSEEHPLQKKFYLHFWQAFYQQFVLPIASQQHLDWVHEHVFERV